MNSRFSCALCVVWLCMSVAGGSLLGEPIVPSYERFQNKNRVKKFHAGRLLLEELNCVACHDSGDATLAPKQAPVLTEVSGRVRASHLRKFIADPQATKPGTTMPGLFYGMSDEDRDAHVEALVHYLYTKGPGEPGQAYARFGAAKRGKELFHTVGCVGCHDPEGKQLKGSFPHGDLPGKYTLASLTAFLQNPQHVRPAGRMPSLNLTANEASDISAYLMPDVPEQAGIEFETYEVSADSMPDFDKLKPVNSGVAAEFDVQKHGMQDNFAIRYVGELMIGEPGRYRFNLGSDDGSILWIDGKVVVNNDGVHGMQRKRGNVELTSGRHALTLGFFEKGGGEELELTWSGPGFRNERVDLAMVAAAPEVPLEDLSFEVDQDLASKGEKLFGSLGCANCHEVGQKFAATLTASPFAKLENDKGCLAETTTVGARYALSDNQRDALRATISDGVRELSAERMVHHTMLKFNCVACHQRANLGGVDTARTEYFTTTQQEMGMEGAIPPHLDGTGGKLTRAWLDQILAKGAKDRPYMKTRMPKFGTDNVGHLAAQLEELDLLEPLPDLKLDSKAAKKAGHKMVGAKGFGCIKCHTFGRYKATGVQSIDMTIMTKRLREDWFRTYVKDPQEYRRGTRMPSAWPLKGPSLMTDVLDADSDRQIAAVWRYLQDGVRAKTPFGLSSSSMELIPIEEAIIYRNFIQGAGSRAIGVGYPESVHLAFDANDLRLALIWQGQFIDASRHWNGRGQGYQPPAGEKVKSLVPGVPIATLESATSPWPSQSARDLDDYSFKGYRLSKDQRPTFYYEIGDLSIADFANPVETQTEVSLQRTLTISGVAKPNTYLRLAVGDITQDGELFDLGDGLKLSILDKAELGVDLREVGGTRELVIPLSDNRNERTIQLDYIW